MITVLRSRAKMAPDSQLHLQAGVGQGGFQEPDTGRGGGKRKEVGRVRRM